MMNRMSGNHRRPAGGLLIAGMCVVAAGVLVAPARGAADQGPGQSTTPETRAIETRLLRKAAQNIEQHRRGQATIRLQTATGEPLREANVEIRQTSHEFLFGCTIFDLVWLKDPHRPELFRQRFAELFNFAVFPFYWRRYEPRPGETMHETIAEVARWCRQNGITTKGHPLVWTNQSGVPLWLRDRSPAELERRLLERIQREVNGFAGLIDIWDVVNEPVNTRAWGNAAGRDYIREPIDRIADYVDKAFRTAHEANPDAHLILNEYNTIAKPDVRERFYQLAQELKRRGTPVTGLGIQAHEPRQHWYPPADVWATFDRLARLGHRLHITEFIPQSGGKPITGGWRKGKWTEQTQADFAEQFFRLSFGHPAVVSINWWGLSDRRIWLPGGGLVTGEYDPKPVYQRLHRLIHDEWTTRLQKTTGEDGTVTFRGFYGRYAIRVTGSGQAPQSFEAVLRHDGRDEWVFKVSQ